MLAEAPKNFERKAWIDGITASEAHSNVVLPEYPRNYLADMLQRYIPRTDIREKTFAIDFVDALNESSPSVKRGKLIDLGNCTLLVCGIMPALATRRNVSLSYYANVGKTAFMAYSIENDDERFELLAKAFEDMVLVITSMPKTHI